MANLKSVAVYAYGCRCKSFGSFRKQKHVEAEIIEREIDLIEKYLIEDQNVSTELRCIIVFENSVTLEYLYPNWSQKIDDERLKSNLKKNSSKIQSFKFTKQWMNISSRLRDDEQSIQEDYRQLLDFSTEFRSETDTVLGFVEMSDMRQIQYVDLKRFSPMMIVGESGMGKTELVISILDSMMKKSKPRYLQFAIIDRDIGEIIDRLNLEESGYLHKFAPVDISDRRSVYKILSEVVEEIERRKILIERSDEVVTYKGATDQFAQIIVTIDRFDNFIYSRFEIMEMFKLIAKADPSLNVRLIMTSRNTNNADFALYTSPTEYFDRTYELKVNSLVSFNKKYVSSHVKTVIELFDRIGTPVKSFETVKLSRDR